MVYSRTIDVLPLAKPIGEMTYEIVLGDPPKVRRICLCRFKDEAEDIAKAIGFAIEKGIIS